MAGQGFEFGLHCLGVIRGQEKANGTGDGLLDNASELVLRMR